ncbi:MAG TPA: glycogen synthase GlgA [bacterium]|nr:glycogen synthase GlgA [bacterium]
MDILMVVPEMVPYAKTGGLADVAGALPPALANGKDKVSAIMPCYRGIEKKFKPAATGVTVTVPILEGDRLIAKKAQVLSAALANRVTVYFVKMDEYFDREALYTPPGGDYPDNCARFTFFCRAALEFMKAKKWRPDVVHCHDWQAALVPIYLKTVYKDDPALAGIHSVFTIHNLGYQGIFWHWDMKLIGLPWEYFNVNCLEYFGRINLLKGALVFADKITTVSRGYAREIQGPELGYGLDGVLKSRSADLAGIVNGIDYQVWDPAIDPALPARYSVKDLSGKALAKAGLQREFKLPEKPAVPIIASISRLTDQKGFDLIASILDDMMKQDMQFVLLGTGEKMYQEIFENAGVKYAGKAGVKIAFNDALAHRIEAGADMFLMPSMYEPCGLNQLISLKYGTVPVVRATGGLDDTIASWDPATKTGNGFKFHDYTAEALGKTLKEALFAYRRPDEWKKIVRNGMMEDHSWKASAREYRSVYNSIVAKG